MIGRAVAGLLAALLLLAAAAPALAQAQPRLPQETLVIETAGGGRYEFTVELATNEPQRQTGLMFRAEMAPDHGMLFDFQTEQDLAFWMKNTPLSLDIIYIKANGRVLDIHRRTKPFSTATLPSSAPARAALELNAGTAKALGIAPGDVVRHRFFRN